MTTPQAPRSTGRKVAMGAGIGCGGLTAFAGLCVALALVFGTTPAEKPTAATATSAPATTPPPPAPAPATPAAPSPTPTTPAPATSAPAPSPTTAATTTPPPAPAPAAPLYTVTYWDEPRRQVIIEVAAGAAAREAFDRAITDKITATSGKPWYVRVDCTTGPTGPLKRTISSGYYRPGTPADADHHAVHHGAASYLAPGRTPCPA